MAATTKKSAKKTKAKPRRAAEKKPPAKQAETISALRRELADALEKQTATSEILRMIAGAGTNLQSVMDTIAENAAKLCDAVDALVWRVDGNVRRIAAHFGSIPMRQSQREGDEIDRATTVGCAILDRHTIHVHDLQAAEADFPLSKTRGIAAGMRSVLVTPLVHNGTAIGAIHIRRREVRPFFDSQIKLLETFADQAVIAIENVRLFKELQVRNRDLTEALEQQTATSEVLGVIAGSPTELQPVLDTVVASAVRLAGAQKGHIYQHDGEFLRVTANYNESLEEIALLRELPIKPVPGSLNLRAFIEGKPFQRLDANEGDYQGPGRQVGARTVLAVPLLREGTAIGTITIWRDVVEAFTERQIELVKTFADQAVIAIENVRLFKELGARNRDLTEALEQQTATSEVLQVISSSPTDVQPVFDAIVQSATRLCDASFGTAHRFEDQVITLDAQHGMTPEQLETGKERFPIPATRGTAVGRAIMDRQVVHVEDVSVDPEYVLLGHQRELSYRTVLAVPLLKDGTRIGALGMWRREVKPFTENQLNLVKTFADQAVIAIENVRLFQQLEARNAELREALEHQTATAEVLGIISRSPTDVQPVLDSIVESAARVCGIDDVVLRLIEGNITLPRAHFGPIPIRRVEIGVHELHLPWMHEHGALQITDVRAQNDFPSLGSASNYRTLLSVPLHQPGELIGALLARRMEVRPFTPTQIKLLETFADQAVIAIENVRLFQELKEALEQQTATSEILGVIASSPTDIQPVLNAVAESAARLCDATDAQIIRVEGDFVRSVASYGSMPARSREELTIITPAQAPMLAIIDRQTIHVHDLAAEIETRFPGSKLAQQRFGTRTLLCAPLLREGVAVGSILIRRTEVRPFSDKQIKLLETFASQAVIAIENVRLFQELKESLEQQTATSEILGVIASSPTDIQPVLDVVAENAARLCGATDAVIYRVDGEVIYPVAVFGSMPPAPKGTSINRRTPLCRAIVDRQTVHVTDLLAEVDNEFPDSKAIQQVTGTRTSLATPLLREGASIGAIHVRRNEVRPFSDKQIKLLETFADQAVIAIENVRLFNELDARNRQLTEALEQQTATSEILRVIASSPTNIQPVLDTVVMNAARVCEATDAAIFMRVRDDLLRKVANYGSVPGSPIGTETPLNRNSLQARTVVDGATIHIHDFLQVAADYPESRALRMGYRTMLSTPLLREGVPIGVIGIRRTEVRPFSDKQIALLQTFADQAVIAIENVRLFQELEARTRELARSVGELKALGEVGQAVSSTLDLQTVLSTIVSRAVQLSGTDCGIIYEYDEPTQEFHLRASYQMEQELVDAYHATPLRLGQGATGRAAETRLPYQIADLRQEHELATRGMRPLLFRLGYQSLLAVPLLLDQKIMGALTIYRRETGSFAPEIVNLLQTFATQSVLAIQNARLFREIEDKGRQIEAANRHKSEFLANVSHELRTPLNAIIGFSEVLGERMFGELNEKQAEYTDDILSSGRHLLSLINDILDLSKIEAGRMELEVTTFNLPDAIENALTLIRERASRHGIRLNQVIDERLGDFTGDERKVKQVLVNLLSNAVKFTPEGGQIKVEASLGDSAAIVSVIDTGIGIAKEDQEAIFEEFRQVGSNYAHKREGTGLGLTLTRKFVELHGGKIWVESDVGKGSKFTFTLPISASAEVQRSSV